MNKEYDFKSNFAKGLSFQKLVYVFIIASIIGAIYESSYGYIEMYLMGETPRWIYHRGVIYGSLNIIYGLGAVLMTIILVRKKRPKWKTFLYAALLGGITEYVVSFIQEKFTGSISWDYSNRFLNIAGRTTVPYMLFWGLLGITFVYLIYPFISKMVEKIPIKAGTIITNVLVTFLILDCIVSWTALFRQVERRKNIPPRTYVGRLYDKYYTDEFLHKYYNNLVYVDE